ncbi:MAG: Hsp70 family protein, partial [Myxococcota bacterium]
MAGNIIGIDLGTTNTCAAFVSNKIPRVIPTESGFNTMPSVVTYLRDGSEFIGQSAKEHIVSNPEATVHEVKRLIGKQFSSPQIQELTRRFRYSILPDDNGEALVEVRGQKRSPIDVQSILLRQIKRYAEIHLGDDIPEAVIAVPAYFTDHQRAQVKEAGTRAGFNVRRIVNEPTAAALAYGFNRGFDQRILIYDFGGGTFDISILKLNGNVFEVIATGGDVFLGGADFDDRIVAWMVNEFQKANRIDLLEDSSAMAKVRNAAERAKIELSLLANTQIRIPEVINRKGKWLDLELVLGRDTLNAMTSDLVDRSFEVIDRLLQERGLRKDAIDEVILVGGQTRMPLVMDRITEVFGKGPRKGVHPDECVAIGAALLGDSLSQVDSVTLTDALSIPIGIEGPRGALQVVLDKHNPLPQNGLCAVATSENDQASLDIDIFQGQAGPVADAEYLGTVQYRDLPPGPAGSVKVSLRMAIDDEGMLEIRASHDSSDGRIVTLSTIERPVLEERVDTSYVKEPTPADSGSERTGIRGLMK